MPPPGSPQPPQKDVDSFVAWMENTLDTQAKGPKAGYVPIQRLNRTEYAASVKALVGVDVKREGSPAAGHPGGRLRQHRGCLERVARVPRSVRRRARQVARLAVGNPNPRVVNVKYSIAANQNPDEPLPLGHARRHPVQTQFPGRRRVSHHPERPRGRACTRVAVENESTVVILIDGKIVFRKPSADRRIWRWPIARGRRTRPDHGAFLEDSRAGESRRARRRRGLHRSFPCGVDENIAKPAPFGGLTGSFARHRTHAASGRRRRGRRDRFNPQGISKTPSRALIFVCDPKPKEEPACARQITENLARRAFRRPVTAEDMDRLMPFYEAGRESGGTFDQGIEQVVAAVLVSPEFLYRGIRGPKGAVPGTEFALTDLELASRLSFFLWNTGPDEELLTLASGGRLDQARERWKSRCGACWRIPRPPAWSPASP